VTPLTIPIHGRHPYDVTADVISLIAYPNLEKKKLVFACAMLEAFVHFHRAKDATWATSLPIARYTPPQHVDLSSALAKGSRKITDRLAAGKAGMAFYEAACWERSGRRVNLAGDPFSKQAVLATIAAETGEKKLRSQETIWAESLPVIHLSVALVAIYDGAVEGDVVAVRRQNIWDS
jgi:hypothetical protein